MNWLQYSGVFGTWEKTSVGLVLNFKRWLEQPCTRRVDISLWPDQISEFVLICELLLERNIILINKHFGRVRLVEVDEVRYPDWENSYILHSPDHYVAGIVG